MELTALIEFAEAYNGLGWSVQEQLRELLDKQEDADLNPNAVEMMKTLIPAAHAVDEDAGLDLDGYIEAWFEARALRAKEEA